MVACSNFSWPELEPLFKLAKLEKKNLDYGTVPIQSGACRHGEGQAL